MPDPAPRSRCVRLDGGARGRYDLGYSPAAGHHYVRFTLLRRAPGGGWEPDPAVGSWARAPVGPAEVAERFDVSEQEAARWLGEAAPGA